MTTNEFIQKLDGLFAAQEYTKVEPFMLSALEEAKEKEDYGLYLSVGNEMIGYYRSISRFQKAYEISEDMLLLMEELQMDQSAEFATVLLNTATAYSFDENFEMALQFYRRAEQIYHLLVNPNDYLFAGLYNNMSSLMEKMGRNEEALELLMKALVILQNYPDRQMEAATNFTNLGLLYLKIGDYESGKKCVIQAVSMFEALDTPASHYSAALSALGEICYHEKDYEQAVVWYEKTLAEIERHYGFNLAYAVVCENLATAYREAGKPAQAEEYLHIAKKIRCDLEKTGSGKGAEDAEKTESAEDAAKAGKRQDAGTGNEEKAGTIAGTESAGAAGSVEKTGNRAEERVEKSEDSTETTGKAERTEDVAGAAGRTENTEKAESDKKAGRREEVKNADKILRVSDAMPKALERCRIYYEQYGKPMLAQFPELRGHFAAGLVGEGSECFGYDDLISADHDYFPRFFIWLDDEAYEKYGEALQVAYRKLPQRWSDCIWDGGMGREQSVCESPDNEADGGMGREQSVCEPSDNAANGDTGRGQSVCEPSDNAVDGGMGGEQSICEPSDNAANGDTGREQSVCTPEYADTVMTPEAAQRCGVCKTTDFYYRLLGRQTPPETMYDWVSLQETRLATVTNGAVFEDCGGGFNAQREAYLTYFPEDVRKKKLAARLRKMAQTGQYQYARCMRRGEYVAAHMALSEFIQYTGSCCFLLAGQYMPYFKWMHRRMKELPVLPGVAKKLEKLTLLPSQQDKWDLTKPEQYRFSLNTADEKVVLIEEIAGMIAAELRRQGLAEGKDSYLEPYAVEVESRIEDQVLRTANLV